MYIYHKNNEIQDVSLLIEMGNVGLIPAGERKLGVKLDLMDSICCPACNGDLELVVKEGQAPEVISGVFICDRCKRRFKIINGIPSMVFPDKLEESEDSGRYYNDMHARTYERQMRYLGLKEGVWCGAFLQTRSRKLVVDKLELKTNHSVLEIGTGTGLALHPIAKQIGKGVRLHASDISLGMLSEAKKKINSKKISAELVQANASYLPYRSCLFDGVLHIGGWNSFADKKRAMQEMHRVAKPGAKIVICDEGLAPGKEFWWMARRIFELDKIKSYHASPPVDMVPPESENCKVYWIWNDVYWVVEYVKKEKTEAVAK